MPKPARELATAYGSKLRRLERTRLRIEDLHDGGRIARRDIEQVYGALLLSCVTSFEALLEELFFGLIMGRLTSTLPGVRSKVSIPSEAVAREVAHGGRAFLTWLPYDRTEERARMYLSRGLPFSNLESGQKSLLQECIFVRNAIAHTSQHAIELYKANVSAAMLLPPRDRSPASYLRSSFRIAPVQCRYEDYASGFLRIALKLCN